MKIVLVVLVILTLAVAGGALLAGPQLRDALKGLTPDPPTTTVRVEPARQGTLIETISAPGEIEPHTDVEIAAEVSARIVELPVRQGQSVARGDVMCRLDDKDLQAALVSSNARRDGEQFRLRSDQARLVGLMSNITFARRELERQQQLFDSGDISGRDLDGALERVQDLDASIEATKYSISVVESSLAAAEADIERSQDGLENTVILAPMDGIITRLNVEVGEIVTGSTTNPGTRLMTIADLTRMIHRAEVAESDIANVAIGQRAKIYINAYPDDVFSGTVRDIALQRSGSPDGTGFFETEIEIDLQGRQIRSGHVANSDIEVATHEGVIVPYQAIVVRDVEELPDAVQQSPLVDSTKRKASVIYRMVDGRAVCTPIRPGSSDLTHRIVHEGLTAEEMIVTGPYKVLESLKNDERISVEKAKKKADTENPPAAIADSDDGASVPDGDS